MLTGKIRNDNACETAESVSTEDALLNEYRVFPAEQEQALISHWSNLGLNVRYCHQQIEYMNHRVTIKYLKVRNPVSGLAVSLVPWFMLIDRPYFIFTYIYGIWHYSDSGQKSLKDSAAAAGKMFGNTTFDKSTLKRNIKSMEKFIDTSRICRALSTEGGGMPPKQSSPVNPIDAREFVTEVMMLDLPVERLKEIYAEYMGLSPEPIRQKVSISIVLKNIPDELSKVIKAREPGEMNSRGIRKWLPRQPGEKKKRVQRLPIFVEDHEIEKIRKAFIEKCRHIVLDAAVTYHQFLV